MLIMYFLAEGYMWGDPQLFIQLSLFYPKLHFLHSEHFKSNILKHLGHLIACSSSIL